MQNPDSKTPRPPKAATIILHWFCNKKLVEEIEGDLEEYYLIYRKRYPKWKAALFYWFHMFSFLRPYSIKRKNSKIWIMISNNFKFSFRYLGKHKTNTLLNVMSLSIGIACFLFTFIYLEGELSYDDYHQDSDRLHRVVIDFVNNNGERTPDATTPPALAPALKSGIPEIEHVARVYPTWANKFLIGANRNLQFYEEDVLRVDASFLDIFSHEIVQGNKDQLLDEPSDIVLTESMAKKYFGEQNPIGQELTFFNRDNEKKIVSGVVKDVPFNSHFTYDFLIPLHFPGRNIDEMWRWYNYYTYVKLKENTELSDFESKLQPIYLANNPHDTINSNITYSQPVRDIHLRSALKWELGANSNMANIKIFFSIGLFILIISLINYLNLTVGHLVQRVKEVSVRKSLGATRKNLIGQFITEALIVILVSLAIGGVLAEIAMSNMSDLFGREIGLLDSENVPTFLILSAITIGFGVLSGLYPALHFSALREDSSTSMTNQRFSLKQILLIVQFTISVIMIIGTMVVYQQLMYFKNADLGFNKEQLLVLENANNVPDQQVLMNKVAELPFVESAGFSDGIVGNLNWTFSIGYPESFLMNYSAVSPGYLKAMEFEFLAGRNFDSNIQSDQTQNTFITNEAGMSSLKLNLDQVGESIVMREIGDSLVYGKVIGVVKDFHFSNFKNEIKPYAFFFRSTPLENLVVRMNTTNMLSNLHELEQTWNDLAPGVPFENYFLDQSYARLHEKEQRMSNLMLYLTILSVFISFIGMLAIANIVIKGRLKEVAIRKTLGATTHQVVNLFTVAFLLLVLIANLIGLPVAYIFMNKWLADFSYRVTIDPLLFVLAFLVTIGLAYLIVGFRSFRVATSRNLSERLRNE